MTKVINALAIARASSILLAMAATPALALDGELDFTFGAQGLYINGFGADVVHSTGAGVAFQADGKLIVGGSSKPPIGSCALAFSAMRISPNATSIDTTYASLGSSQVCLTPILAAGVTGDHEYVSSAQVTTDGGFLESGYVSYSSFSAPPTGVLMKRTSNGTLDATFGVGGMVKLRSNDLTFGGVNGAIQRNDGTIFAIGTNGTGTSASQLWARQSDGAVITEFDDTQVLNAYAQAIALQPDGKIVVAGTYTSPASLDGCFITRFIFQSGLLIRDTSFGAGGIFEVAADASSGTNYICRAVAVQPDGKILFGGRVGMSDAGDIVVGRVSADGKLDKTFATLGIGTTYFSSQNADNQLRSIVVNPDGKINLVGYGSTDSTKTDYNFGVIRLSSKGDYDGSFGTDPQNIATVIIDFAAIAGGTSNDQAQSAALVDGNLVIVGNVSTATKSWFGMARITATDSIFANRFE